MENLAFNSLVSRFGRTPGSHLFPLFNYFFVPQTKAQFKKWKESCGKGLHNQNLLFTDADFDLVKIFCPSVEKKHTKSKMIRVLNFDLFIQAVENHINSRSFS